MVILPLAAAFKDVPLTADQPFLFQAVQHRVQRAFFKAEIALAALLKLLNNLVALHRLITYHVEQKGLNIA